MQPIVLYLSTALIFLAADAVALRFLIRPVFERHVGDWLLDSPRLGPAAAFYLFYVAGLVWMVSWPALRSGVPAQALWNGALLGALAYGTYEFTNYATLRDWSPVQVAIDGAWGTILTGVAAWAGVVATRAIT